MQLLINWQVSVTEQELLQNRVYIRFAAALRFSFSFALTAPPLCRYILAPKPELDEKISISAFSSTYIVT